jgi:hypothetical protein
VNSPVGNGDYRFQQLVFGSGEWAARGNWAGDGDYDKDFKCWGCACVNSPRPSKEGSLTTHRNQLAPPLFLKRLGPEVREVVQ